MSEIVQQNSRITNRGTIKMNFSTPSHSTENKKDVFVFGGGLLNLWEQKQLNGQNQQLENIKDANKQSQNEAQNTIALCLEHKSKAIYTCEDDSCSVKNKTGCHKCINIYHYSHKVKMIEDSFCNDYEELNMQKQMAKVKESFTRFQNMLKVPGQSENTIQSVNDMKNQQDLEKKNEIENQCSSSYSNKSPSDQENDKKYSLDNKIKINKSQLTILKINKADLNLQSTTSSEEKLRGLGLKEQNSIPSKNCAKIILPQNSIAFQQQGELNKFTKNQCEINDQCGQLINTLPSLQEHLQLPISTVDCMRVCNNTQTPAINNSLQPNHISCNSLKALPSSMGIQLQGQQINNFHSIQQRNNNQLSCNPFNVNSGRIQIQQSLEYQQKPLLQYATQIMPTTVVAYFPQQYPQNYFINLQQNAQAPYPQIYCQNPYMFVQQNQPQNNIQNCYNYPQISSMPSQNFNHHIQSNLNNQNFTTFNTNVFDIQSLNQQQNDLFQTQNNQPIYSVQQQLQQLPHYNQQLQPQQINTNLIVNQYNQNTTSLTNHSVNENKAQSNTNNHSHLSQENLNILNISISPNPQPSKILLSEEQLPVEAASLQQTQQSHLRLHHLESPIQEHVLATKIERQENTDSQESKSCHLPKESNSAVNEDSNQTLKEAGQLKFKLKEEQIDEIHLTNTLPKKFNHQSIQLQTKEVERFKTPISNEGPRVIQQQSIPSEQETIRSNRMTQCQENQIKIEATPFNRSFSYPFQGQSFSSSCNSSSNNKKVNVQYFIENKCMKSQYTSLDKVVHQHIDYYPSIAFLSPEKIIQISLNTFEMKYYLNLVDVKSKKILQRREISPAFQTQKRSLQFDDNKRIIIQKINNELSAIYERGENYVDFISNTNLKVVKRVKQYSIQKIATYNKGRAIAIASLSCQVVLYNINNNKFIVINSFNVRKVKPKYIEVTQISSQRLQQSESENQHLEEEEEVEEEQQQNEHSDKFSLLLSCDIFIQGNKMLWCGSSLYKFTYCFIDIASSARMILEPTQANYPNGIINNDSFKIQISNVQIFNYRVYFEFRHIEKSSDHFLSDINSCNSLQFSKYNIIQYKIEQQGEEMKLVFHSSHLNSNIIKVSDPQNQIFLYSQQKAHIIGIQFEKEEKKHKQIQQQSQQSERKMYIINNVAYFSSLFNKQPKEEPQEIKFKMNISQFQNSQTLYVYLTKSQRKQQQNKNEQFITLVDNKKIFHKVFLSQSQYTTKIN